MDEVQLANYLAGVDPGPVEAGRLGADLALLLGVPAGTVLWLSEYSITKIRYRHPKVDFATYLAVPWLLLNGFVSCGNQPNTIEICGIHRIPPLMACIKKTADAKVYLTTLHPVDRKEARRLYRRAKKASRLLRSLDEFSERRLLAGGKEV